MFCTVELQALSAFLSHCRLLPPHPQLPKSSRSSSGQYDVLPSGMARGALARDLTDWRLARELTAVIASRQSHTSIRSTNLGRHIYWLITPTQSGCCRGWTELAFAHLTCSRLRLHEGLTAIIEMPLPLPHLVYGLQRVDAHQNAS